MQSRRTALYLAAIIFGLTMRLVVPSAGSALPPRTANFRLSWKQYQALQDLRSPVVDDLLYGGAKGGGKSVLGCVFCYLRAKELIKDYGLKPSKVPLVVGFMGRKVGTDFRDTTLETWKRMIPAGAYRIKTQEKLIIIEETVAIRYGGLDDSDTVNKFNSAEFVFFFLDQAEECSQEDVGMLRGTLRIKINGHTPKYVGLLTANPAICWLKGEFITTPKPGTKFLRALYTDNPFLPADYGHRLDRSYGFNPSLLRAYKEGVWEDLDQAFVIIKYADIEACVNRIRREVKVRKKVTVADIGEMGDDETVIYDMWDVKIHEQEIYAHHNPMDTVGRIVAHQKTNESNLICLDKIGVGSGPYFRLCQIYENDPKVQVYGFDGRVKPPEGLARDTYANYKSYAWFRAAHKFYERQADIPDDDVLKSQLAGVTFHFANGERYMVDAKEKLKENLGGSPDRADTYVMALDALDRAEPLGKRDRYEEDEETEVTADSV